MFQICVFHILASGKLKVC